MFETLADPDSQGAAADPTGFAAVDSGMDSGGFAAADSGMDAVGFAEVDPAGFGGADSGRSAGADPLGFAGMDPFVDPVGFLTAATEMLAKLPSQLWRTGNEGFAGIVSAMDALAVQVECARVGLVDQAESRGVVDQSPAPSTAAWLIAHSPHLEPADASRTAKLSHLCALPKNQVMAASVSGGTVTVRKAMTALGQLAAIEDDLAPGVRRSRRWGG